MLYRVQKSVRGWVGLLRETLDDPRRARHRPEWLVPGTSAERLGNSRQISKKTRLNLSDFLTHADERVSYLSWKLTRDSEHTFTPSQLPSACCSPICRFPVLLLVAFPACFCLASSPAISHLDTLPPLFISRLTQPSPKISPPSCL